MDTLSKTAITRSYYWMGLSSVLSRLLSFVTTLILAKLLSPDDFGIVSIAVLVGATLGLVRDLGLNQAIIHSREKSEDILDTALIASVGISVLMYGIAAVSAGEISLFFKNDDVQYVVRVLPFSLVVTSISSIYLSHMERELDFKRRFVPELASYAAYTAVSITLAVLGFAYWSIIFGHIILELVRLVVVMKVSDFHTKLSFKTDVFFRLFDFGKFIVTNSIIVFIYRNIDDFMIGRLLGTTPLGYYSLAYRIGNMPATNVTHLTGKVTYPALMKMRNEPDDAVSFYLKVFRYLSMIIIPLGIGTIALIEPFFHLFFGDKWNAAILPTQLLAVFGMLRGLFSNLGYLFIMLDRVREMTLLLSAQLVLLLSLIYPVTVRYDLAGICLLLLVLNLLVSIVSIVRLRTFFPGLIGAHIKRMLFPLFLSLVSFVGPRMLFEVLVEVFTLPSFLFLVMISLALYCTVMLLGNRNIIDEMRSFYSSVIVSDE